MKNHLALIVIFCFISCGAIRQLANENVTSKNDCEAIALGKSPLLPLKIDGANSHFLFDTGATRSVLLDSAVVYDFKNKKISSLGSARGADKKKVPNRLLTVKLDSPLFECDTKVLSIITMASTSCNSSQKKYSGILGLDVFFENDLSMQIDFTDDKVCNITDQQLQQHLSDNKYKLIKSKCKASQIFVYLSIEGKEYPFKLDTGYTGNIVMPFNEKVNFENENKMELEGSLFQTISSHTTGKETMYEKMPIAFGQYNLESKMTVSSTIKAQNIGIGFIKGFDWLIDYNHNKVYVKRNQNPIESNFNKKVSYYAKVNQEKLLIVVKEKSLSKYRLGDQIIAVNGQKVTAENQCELQDLLNKTDDWNSLQLEVVSNLK